MRKVKRLIGPGLLVLLLVAGCSRNPAGEPTPTTVPAAPTESPTPAPVVDTPTSQPPTATPTTASTPTSTPIPVTESDLENALQIARDFLAKLADGGFREVYGSLLTTAGQERLAELVLGRLSLTNPHISYFELLGAEPVDDGIAVDVTWQESYDGQGLVGSQEARLLLARQDGTFLVDDALLSDFQPAATPVPPPLPRAEALTNPAIPGEEMRFRASGFEGGETVLAWLEAPDGTLFTPDFNVTDENGAAEVVYPAGQTGTLIDGRWIWWAQALRDSTRNTGITFEVLPAPTATPTPVPTPIPTRPPATPTPAVVPTDTPEPSPGYAAPVALWPEPVTSREYNSALIVEFVPVADELAPDELYELVLEARDGVGNVYNAGSVRGRGDNCSTPYDQPCRSLTANERFMRLFHPDGIDGQGTWWVQVVRETGPEQFTVISPPSEPRTVILKPRPN